MHRFRYLWMLLACALAACSASGGGSTLPSGQLPAVQAPGATPPPTPVPTPPIVSASIIAGDGAPQTIPAFGEYRVSASFPQSSSPPVPLRVTTSQQPPKGVAGYPDGKKRKKNSGPAPALLYVSILAEHDTTLTEIPTFSFTVPLAVLEPFQPFPQLALAQFDTGDARWTTGIAERRSLATAAPSASASSGKATAAPSPSPSPTPSPTPSPHPSGSLVAFATPTPRITGSVDVRFVPGARPFKVSSKKPAVFVLYVEPSPSPSPSSASSSSAPGAKRNATPLSSADASTPAAPGASSATATANGASSASGAPVSGPSASPAPAASAGSR